MPYELLEEEDIQPESTLGYAGRTIGRTIARAGESIAGLPGDIASIPLSLGNYAAKALTGKDNVFPERVNLLHNSPARHIVKALTGKDFNLPTSGDIKKDITEKLTGNTLEPQGSGEQLWDDIVSDAATIFLPLSGKIPGGNNLISGKIPAGNTLKDIGSRTLGALSGKIPVGNTLKDIGSRAIGALAEKIPGKNTIKGIGSRALGALGRSTAGNVAKIATEEITGSPILGLGAKIGAMALASTYGGRKVMTQAKDDLYKQSYNNIPQKKFDIVPEKLKMDSIFKAVSKGDKQDKSFLLDRIEAFNKIMGKGGKANIKDIIDIKQDWNDHLRSGYLAPQARGIFIKMRDIAKDAIDRYGKHNPKFEEFYKPAEQLTAALNGSNYIQNIISKHPYLKDSVSNPLLKKFLGGSAISALGYGGHKILGLAGTGALAAGALTAREAARFYQLLSRSPYAMKYYKDVATSALKDDIKALPKALSNLNNAANRFDEEEPLFEERSDEGQFELLD